MSTQLKYYLQRGNHNQLALHAESMRVPVLPTYCILCRNGKLDQNLLMPKAMFHLIHLIGGS